MGIPPAANRVKDRRIGQRFCLADQDLSGRERHGNELLTTPRMRGGQSPRSVSDAACIAVLRDVSIIILPIEDCILRCTDLYKNYLLKSHISHRGPVPLC